MRRGWVWPMHAALAPPHLQQDLRDLGGLARAGLAADDDHRVRGDRALDFLPPLVDRERRVEMYARLHLQNLRARI